MWFTPVTVYSPDSRSPTFFDAVPKKTEAALTKREKKVGILEQTIKNNTVPGDGTFEVGKDMKAGTYKSPGPDGDQCYSRVASGR